MADVWISRDRDRDCDRDYDRDTNSDCLFRMISSSLKTKGHAIRNSKSRASNRAVCLLVIAFALWWNTHHVYHFCRATELFLLVHAGTDWCCFAGPLDDGYFIKKLRTDDRRTTFLSLPVSWYRSISSNSVLVTGHGHSHGSRYVYFSKSKW
jgi:hypothetical protein